jgi:hypothetical protein
MAQYFLVGRSAKYLGCTITDLSRNGAGALFPMKEKLETGAIILLDMLCPGTFQRVSVVGEIKRSYKKSSAVFGGIQFQPPLSEDVFSMLCDVQAQA